MRPEPTERRAVLVGEDGLDQWLGSGMCIALGGLATACHAMVAVRHIIRRNLPPLEAWFAEQGGIFDYVRPVAGAIAFARYRLPIASARLVDRIRERCSVLLVPGDQFRAGKGIRFGFGYDIAHTLEGLALVQSELRKLRRAA